MQTGFSADKRSNFEASELELLKSVTCLPPAPADLSQASRFHRENTSLLSETDSQQSDEFNKSDLALKLLRYLNAQDLISLKLDELRPLSLLIAASEIPDILKNNPHIDSFTLSESYLNPVNAIILMHEISQRSAVSLSQSTDKSDFIKRAATYCLLKGSSLKNSSSSKLTDLSETIPSIPDLAADFNREQDLFLIYFADTILRLEDINFFISKSHTPQRLANKTTALLNPDHNQSEACSLIVPTFYCSPLLTAKLLSHLEENLGNMYASCDSEKNWQLSLATELRNASYYAAIELLKVSNPMFPRTRLHFLNDTMQKSEALMQSSLPIEIKQQRITELFNSDYKNLLDLHRMFISTDAYNGAMSLQPVERTGRLISVYFSALAHDYWPEPKEVLAETRSLPEYFFPVRLEKTTATGNISNPHFESLPVPLYFAGALFDNCDLSGNKLFAKAILNASKGSIRPFLPQDHEQTDIRAEAIKKQDLWNVLVAGMALFNFNGSPVDDGTIVEFEAAQRLGIPIIALRTDFRAAGDGVDSETGQSPAFNLMMSGAARCEVLNVNSIVAYQRHLRNSSNTLTNFHSELSLMSLDALERARSKPSRFGSDLERALAVYNDFIEEKNLTVLLENNGGQAFLRSLLRFKAVNGLL